MKAIIVFGMFLPGLAFAADDEAAVRHVVRAFYMAFDEGFVKPVDFATDDWYHINPFGGIDRGLEATLKTVREVHTTFLKGVTDTPEDSAIRFASRLPFAAVRGRGRSIFRKHQRLLLTELRRLLPTADSTCRCNT